MCKGQSGKGEPMYVDNLDMLKDSIDNICSKKVSGNVKFIVESASGICSMYQTQHEDMRNDVRMYSHLSGNHYINHVVLKFHLYANT